MRERQASLRCRSCAGDSACIARPALPALQVFAPEAGALPWDDVNEYTRDRVDIYFCSRAGGILKEKQVLDVVQGNYPTGFVEQEPQVRTSVDTLAQCRYAMTCRVNVSPVSLVRLTVRLTVLFSDTWPIGLATECAAVLGGLLFSRCVRCIPYDSKGRPLVASWRDRPGRCCSWV